jgi:hypothetical protein
VPTLGTVAFSTNENITLKATVTATDPTGGAITFAQTGNPSGGKVTSFMPSGAFVYQPNPNYSGSDSFTISATDAEGGVTAGTVTITVTVNQPPVSGNYISRVDGNALNSINVLAVAHDPDGDPLTVSIVQQPLVGSASVNSDGTVSITGLPAGFKGLTRFSFSVTDPSNAAATANAVVFVGADPFRAAFAGDAAGNGSVEVYLTDFVSTLTPMTAATQGNMRLRGFAAAANGATIAYRRADMTTPTTTDLSFVQTANPSQQVMLMLPTGVTPAQDAHGKDQFVVSPDGNWIAAVASGGGVANLYVVNVASAGTIVPVGPAGTTYVALPRFSSDSKGLYFLASANPAGTGKSLYLVMLSDVGTPVQVSASPMPNSADDVLDYSVAPDQSRMAIEANRGGAVGLYFIDPRQLQTEVLVSAPLAAGQSIIATTLDAPPGQGAATFGERVAYSTYSAQTISTYVAEVSGAPNPRAVASSGALVIGFRPDDAALLYSRGGVVYENIIDSGTSDQVVGGGGSGWYDSTGNIVLLEQSLPIGVGAFYPALAVAVRGSFGTTQPLGTPLAAAQYVNVSGYDRAVVLLGEGPATGTPASSVHLALVNALAPSALLYLATFQTPVQLSTDSAQVVTY